METATAEEDNPGAGRTSARRVGTIIAVISAAVAAYAVDRRLPASMAFGFYLVSVAGTAIALLGLPRLGHLAQTSPRRAVRHDALVLIPIILVQLGLVAYFAGFPDHFHQDEFVEAYTSYQLPSITRIDWFAGYPAKGTWVCQFPILFFALQKPFLMLLGPTVESIRVSVWPYLALTTLYLYLIARELAFDRRLGLAAAGSFVLFAPSLYLSSLGVQFHGSTLFLLAALYHSSRTVRTGSRLQAVLTGAFAAGCYLSYSASYVALPILLVCLAAECLVRWSLRPARRLLPALPAFSAILLPFGVYAATRDDYFVQRLDQVNLVSGSWSAAKRGKPVWPLLQKQLTINLQALYRDHVGGVTGYTFGHHALFDHLGIALLLVGGVAALYLAMTRRRAGFLYPFIVLGAIFAGMTLTVPAGAIHRAAIAFPFVGLLVGLGIVALARLAALPLDRAPARRITPVVAAGLLLAFAVVNLQRAPSMMSDQTHPSPLIAALVEANVPSGGTVLIAAPSDYHLQRELFFRTDARFQFLTESLREIEQQRKASLVVLLNPSRAALQGLPKAFDGGTTVFTVNGKPLSGHVLFFPAPVGNGHTDDAPRRLRPGEVRAAA